MAKHLTEHAVYTAANETQRIAAYLNARKHSTDLRKAGHVSTMGWDDERKAYVVMGD